MSEANVLQKRSFWSVLSTDLLAIAGIKQPQLNETKSSQKGPNAATDEALNGIFDLTALCPAPRSLPTAPINIEALALQIRNHLGKQARERPRRPRDTLPNPSDRRCATKMPKALTAKPKETTYATNRDAIRHANGLTSKPDKER